MASKTNNSVTTASEKKRRIRIPKPLYPLGKSGQAMYEQCYRYLVQQDNNEDLDAALLSAAGSQVDIMVESKGLMADEGVFQEYSSGRTGPSTSYKAHQEATKALQSILKDLGLTPAERKKLMAAPIEDEPEVEAKPIDNIRGLL